MATRGYENFTQADVTRRALKQQAAPKPSKYHNVKVVVDGERFDSKREAARWLELKALENAGDIRKLQRQVDYPLCCASPSLSRPWVVPVAVYRADFVYEQQRADNEFPKDTQWRIVVEDVKGGRATKTAMYTLKKRWLCLQENIIIEET